MPAGIVKQYARKKLDAIVQLWVNWCAFTGFYCSMDDMLVGISGHSSAAGA